MLLSMEKKSFVLFGASSLFSRAGEIQSWVSWRREACILHKGQVSLG